MKWYLVVWAYLAAGGGDPGIIQGYVAPTQRVEIEMPSQEICESIAKLNANNFRSGECWARLMPTLKSYEGIAR